MKFKNQKEMFDWIWENRAEENGFRSELSGKPLLPKGHFQWHWQFLHVLPKGTYPAYKFDSENILLGLPNEHENQERFEVFQNKKDELIPKYYKEIYNKTFN